jgi:hypothetical protein
VTATPPRPATRFPARRAEAARLALLAAAATWLLHPFATTRQVGAGDALWYANMLADFVLQLRAGVFPVFVGQTDFAFNGAVYPLRVAPLYQHLAGLLDLLTGRQLGFFALQHLCVLVMGYAGIFSCYFSLTRIDGAHRWAAAALAILYLGCPGLLGTIYTQDQYMTWMTLPFVPLVLLGLVKTFTADSFTAHATQAAALAALWLAHAPIALWLTLIVAALQLLRLLWFHRDKTSWLRALAGAAIFLLLSHYPFVSVATIQLPGAASAVTGALPRAVLIPQNVRDAFPAALLPLSDHARSLGDLQLGYSLALILIAATWILLSHLRLCASVFQPSTFNPQLSASASQLSALNSQLPDSPPSISQPSTLNSQLSAPLAGLLGASAFLLLLLLPFPGNAWLWAHLPAQLVRITYYWPMQRFYLLLAGLVTAGGFLALTTLLPGRPKLRLPVAVLLGAACAWTLWESRQFVAAGRERTLSAATTAQNLRPENRLLMNHAYGLFSRLPDTFSNGTVDPFAQSRLRTAEGDFIAEPTPTPPIQTGTLLGTVDDNPGILKLAPSFRLSTGRRYRLTFAFSDRPYAGILQIIGHRLFREYALPASGEAAAFGSAPPHPRTLNLWSSDPAGDEITLRFIPTAPGAKPTDFATFAGFTLETIAPESAPVVTHSLLPYRATVRAPRDAWLETPRMAARDYRATVNDVPTPTRRSPDGLLWVAVPRGEHAVEVVFVPPAVLRLSYWVSLAAWTGLVAAALAFAVRRIRSV